MAEEPVQASLLQLQRSVGNRVVAAMLSDRDLSAQRHPLPEDEEAPELQAQRTVLLPVQRTWPNETVKADVVAGIPRVESAIEALKKKDAKIPGIVAAAYQETKDEKKKIKWAMMTPIRDGKEQDGQSEFYFGNDNRGDTRRKPTRGGGLYDEKKSTAYISAFTAEGGKLEDRPEGKICNSVAHEGMHALSHKGALGFSEGGRTPDAAEQYRGELIAYWQEDRPEFVVPGGQFDAHARAERIRNFMGQAPAAYPFMKELTKKEKEKVERALIREMNAGNLAEEMIAAHPAVGEFLRYAKLGREMAKLTKEVGELARTNAAIPSLLRRHVPPAYQTSPWFLRASGAG